MSKRDCWADGAAAHMTQTFRVGEEVELPLRYIFGESPKMKFVHAEHPKKHFVVTEVNEAEGSITLASALVEKTDAL